MPRPLQSQGRPGTQVIPTGWEAGHRPVADKTHRAATVQLRHPGTRQAFDPDTEQMVEVPNEPYWTGPARIQALDTRDQVRITAGDRDVVIRYDVSITADALPAVNDLVTVTEIDDAQLGGRTLLVAQITGGSLRFERNFGCALTD